jgi:hypothetical protein
MITFNETNPLVAKDSNFQFRAFGHQEAPHAKGWVYGAATAAQLGNDDRVVLFNADV